MLLSSDCHLLRPQGPSGRAGKVRDMAPCSAVSGSVAVEAAIPVLYLMQSPQRETSVLPVRDNWWLTLRTVCHAFRAFHRERLQNFYLWPLPKAARIVDRAGRPPMSSADDSP